MVTLPNALDRRKVAHTKGRRVCLIISMSSIVSHGIGNIQDIKAERSHQLPTIIILN